MRSPGTDGDHPRLAARRCLSEGARITFRIALTGRTGTVAGSSTFHAFLEGDVAQRPNLELITHAQVTRVVLERSGGQLAARGVEYRTASGETLLALARREVVLSAGAVGSPQVLLLSGIGPKGELEAVGVECQLDSPHVGKHLKDHLHMPLFFTAPGVGVSVAEVGMSMGPDVLRAPAGPLPANPADDADLPAELQALKQEADRRLSEWATTGHGLASSSTYDACAWFSPLARVIGTPMTPRSAVIWSPPCLRRA